MNWISVKDSLPPPFVRVLTCFTTPFTDDNYLFSFGFQDEARIWYIDDAMHRAYNSQVTHWCKVEPPPLDIFTE